MTPPWSAPADSSLGVLVTATSVGGATKRDAVKAITTCALARRVDGLIHDGTAYIGDEVFNTNGASQAHSRTANPDSVAMYLARFYNDGNAADSFRITGRAGNSSWQVRYFDHATGADITADVTGRAGRHSPPLPARTGWCALKSPRSHGPPGTRRSLSS